jgi:hypothetical protein
VEAKGLAELEVSDRPTSPTVSHFVEGEPFVKQNVFKSVDPKTGRPEVDPEHKPWDRQENRFLPLALGRQKLAAGRVQSDDAHALHPGERKPLR